MGDLCKEINKLGKGIGNTARYRILEALQRSPKTVSQLTKIVKLSQPAVSQHLKTLVSCNLVDYEKNGQQVEYRLNTKYMLNLLNKFGTNFKNKPTDKK